MKNNNFILGSIIGAITAIAIVNYEEIVDFGKKVAREIKESREAHSPSEKKRYVNDGPY